MSGFLFSLLPTLIVLGVLIFVHELGHFLACKRTGVAVEKFSIGFGPEIFHFQYQETRVSLSIIPFGGFVKPKGENLDEIKDRVIEPDDYLAKGLGAKTLVVSSGVLMNFVLAFVLFIVVFMVGRPVMQPVIGELMPGYPAKESGVLPKDRVLSVDGEPVKDWNSLTFAIMTSKNNPILLEIERQGQVVHIEVAPKEESVETQGKQKMRVKRIGIKPGSVFTVEKFGFWGALKESANSVAGFTLLTYRVLWGLITGEISFRNIAGPVGIMAITGETAKQGIVSLLQLMALLSVNLAVINLLPIPALDGGHLLFLGIEFVRRKALDQKVLDRITQVGFALLMGLMVFIVINDVQNFGIIEKIKGIFVR